MFGGSQDRGGRAPLPEEVAAEAQALVDRGKQVRAITVIRKATGMGLKEAKDVADAIRDGHSVSVAPSAWLPLADQVRELRRQDRVADAIRHVAAETGMTETESARFIDSLD